MDKFLESQYCIYTLVSSQKPNEGFNPRGNTCAHRGTHAGTHPLTLCDKKTKIFHTLNDNLNFRNGSTCYLQKTDSMYV